MLFLEGTRSESGAPLVFADAVDERDGWQRVADRLHAAVTELAHDPAAIAR